MILGLVLAAVLGLIPAAIANGKGRNFLGWWLFGFAFMIIAFPASLLIKRDTDAIDSRAIEEGTRKRCPHCAELVHVEARVCKHCDRDIPVGLPSTA